MKLDNFFKRTLRKREQDAGLEPEQSKQPVKPPKEGATQADFFYGTSDDLRKKRK